MSEARDMNEPPVDGDTGGTVVQLPVQPETRRRLTPSAVLRGALDVSALRGGYGLKPLVALGLLGIFVEASTSTFGTLKPFVKQDLGLDYTRFFGLTSAVALLLLLFAGPLGYLADRVRRTVLVAAGGVVAAIATFLTGLAYSPLLLGGARAVYGAGANLNLIPENSLLADWYPTGERIRVLTLREGMKRAGVIVVPLLLGVVAATAGWRVSFWLAAIPLALLSVYVGFALREPVRGYQERRAQGADEAAAQQEQAPPSWGEAWRSLWASRTYRALLILFALSFVSTDFAGLTQFWFTQHWHQGPAQLAAIQSVQSVLEVIGLVAGGSVLNVVARARPQRVLVIFGWITVLSTAFTVLYVLVPIYWLSVATTVTRGALGSVLTGALYAVMLNVMPPRARSLGASAFAYAAIPSQVVQVGVGSLADSIGLQGAALIGAIAPLGMAIMYFVAARGYEHDVRTAQVSAMAEQEWQRRRRAGQTQHLLCRGVDVHYGSVQVLFAVDIDVAEGEMVALLGTNGAGKSTLLRAVSGLTPASGGAILLDGVDITHLPPHEIASRGCVYMRGGQSGFPSLSVRENLRLGAWLYGRRPEHDADMQRVFEHFPVLRARLDQLAGTLSGGEQQMLALGQAFLARPRLLLIDELSLGLAPAVVEQLLDIVRAIHARGTTVLLVEQSVNVALRLARRAVFMEKGEVRFSGPTEELLRRPEILRSVFLQGAARTVGVGGAGAAARAAAAERPVVLEVQALRKAFGGRPVLDGVDLTLRDGEILGIIGPNGAGKTTLFDLLSGFTAPDAGSIVLGGEDITLWRPDRRARAGLVRRFQDARLFPTLTVAETIAVSFERQLELRTMLLQGLDLPAARRAEQRLRSQVDQLVDVLHLQAFRDKFVSDLSTGSRRLVDLACTIAAGPRVLLLDEPSAGVAQREAEEMGPLLQRVRHHTGCSMLVIEHDMALLAAVADEMVALHLGHVLLRGRPADVLGDARVVDAYLGRATAASGAPA
jgi:branched-chain amino acid transport system ATP-binding protein